MAETKEESRKFGKRCYKVGTKRVCVWDTLTPAQKRRMEAKDRADAAKRGKKMKEEKRRR